jgi:hypothetical protein
MNIIYSPRNRKLASADDRHKVITTYTTTGANCPLSCTFHPDNDSPNKCYTSKGHTAIHARNAGGIEHGKLLRYVVALLEKRQAGDSRALGIEMLRIHTAGDVIDPTTGRPDVEYIAELVTVCDALHNAGIAILAYTHAWKDADAEPLKRYFMASCDTWEDVAEARACGWLTTKLETDDATPADVKAVTCPNQITDGHVKCYDCMLCSPARLGTTSKRVIIFRYH